MIDPEEQIRELLLTICDLGHGCSWSKQQFYINGYHVEYSATVFHKDGVRILSQWISNSLDEILHHLQHFINSRSEYYAGFRSQQ